MKESHIIGRLSDRMRLSHRGNPKMLLFEPKYKFQGKLFRSQTAHNNANVKRTIRFCSIHIQETA